MLIIQNICFTSKNQCLAFADAVLVVAYYTILCHNFVFYFNLLSY